MKKILFVIMFMTFLFACSEDDKDLTSISLDKTELTLKVGEEYTFNVIKSPNDAISPGYEWYVNLFNHDDSVGKVDENGRFTALNEGKIVVVAIVKGSNLNPGGAIKAECFITVEAIQAETMELSQRELSMKKGDKVELTYKLSPKGAADNLKWNVSDEKVVSIDVKGDGVIFVTALKPGEAKIYTTLKDKEYACIVTVDPIKVESVIINPTEKTVKQGDKFNVIASVMPENADNSEITYSSSNESIATVDQAGNVQTLLPGTCSIWATASDNNIKAECKVTVLERPFEELITTNVYGSSTSINGYTTADVVAAFYNNSDKTVEVTEFTMYDTRTNKIVYQQKDCGFVEYKKPLQYELKFSMVYKPLFIWKYTSQGKTYESQYQM